MPARVRYVTPIFDDCVSGDDEPARPGEKPRGGLAALRGLLDEVQDDVLAGELA
jgi:hypothetical protein